MTISFDESSSTPNAPKKLTVAIVVAAILIVTGIAVLIFSLASNSGHAGSTPTDPSSGATVPTDSGETKPVDPTVPSDGTTDPTGGTQPAEPTNPTDPTIPTDSTQPTGPTSPGVPTDPSTPTDPPTPSDPATPTEPDDDAWIQVGNGDPDPDGWLPLIP